MVYIAPADWDIEKPGAMATVERVSVDDTAMGPVYTLEEAVAGVPFVVK
jgi:hypothetical protein